MRHMIDINFLGNNLYKVTNYFGTRVIHSMYRSGGTRSAAGASSFKRLCIDMSTP